MTTDANQTTGGSNVRHLNPVPAPEPAASCGWDPADDPSVWAAVRAGDRSARDHLLVTHHPLVVKVASRVHTRLAHHDLGDLIGAGVFGLIAAVEMYDPEREKEFATYAYTRIRGAILDDVRRNDWAPRTVRAGARTIEDARDHLENELGRHPTHAELAAHLGIKPRHLSRTLADVTCLRVAALDKPREHGASLADCLAEPGADPGEQLEQVAAHQELADALNGIADDRIKLVLVLYYFERMPMADIGTVLGVTESRVSQMNRTGLGLLRTALRVAQAA